MRSPSVTCSYAVSHPTPVVRFVTVAWLQVSINPWLAVILRDKGNSNQYSPAYPDTFTFWYQKTLQKWCWRFTVSIYRVSASLRAYILQLTPRDLSHRMQSYNTRPYHKSPTPTDVSTVHYVIIPILHPLRLFSVKHLDSGLDSERNPIYRPHHSQTAYYSFLPGLNYPSLLPTIPFFTPFTRPPCQRAHSLSFPTNQLLILGSKWTPLFCGDEEVYSSGQLNGIK